VIEVDGESIGFIFINQWLPSGRGTDYAVAEFYIAPRWRGQGHGTEAVRTRPSGTCVQGYVWRAANPGDHVCVRPATLAQTRSDNTQACRDGRVM
jgi:GNAT superfamily N-acetyltransferase